MKGVNKEHAGKRLDHFLSDAFSGCSRGAARRALAAGEVWVNGVPVKVMSRQVKEGDRVTWLVLPPLEGEPPVVDWRVFGGRPDFLHKDGYMAILNKASGVPVESTHQEDLRTCIRQIEAKLHEEGLMAKRIYVAAAHRLDAGASGVLAFGLRKQAAARLGEQFAARSAKRIYRAIVVGQIEEEQLRIEQSIGKVGTGIKRGVVGGKRGKHAVTHVRVLERMADASLIEAELETGRTHQIRVHLAHLGHPLVGDWLYCDEAAASRVPEAPRLMLHALRLTLQHPRSNELMTFEAPEDEAFLTYLEALR